MVERITWNGKTYRRYPDSGHASNRRYFQRSFSGGTRWLHQDVWEFHHGPIPNGFHIHHKDGNTLNNAANNLECLAPKQHMAQHQWSAERRVAQSVVLDRLRPLTKEWHASPDGRAKHRQIGAMAYAAFVPEAKACKHCESVFTPRKIGNADLFCSNACKSAFRRAAGIDNQTRICAHCGASFECNRYSKQKACSRACGNSLRGATMRARL